MSEIEAQVKIGQGTKDKKQIRRDVNKIARGVIIYEIIMILVVIIDLIVRMSLLYMKSDNEAWIDSQADKLINSSMNSGTSSIIAITLGVTFIIWYFRRFEFGQAIFTANKKMTVRSFFMAITVFMSIQLVFNILGVAVEAGLNQFGYSLSSEIESAAAGSKTLSMLLYASFLGPITEEIVFRGYVMRGLRKYGKVFAIIISAIVFGAFHGNFIQGVFAALGGLVLGYVAMEYSIKWSIALHIVNNFIFGDLLSYIISGLNDRLQLGLGYSMDIAFFIAGAVILFFNRNKIRNYMAMERTNRKIFVFTFTSIWMIIFLILQLAQGVLGVEKI